MALVFGKPRPLYLDLLPSGVRQRIIRHFLPENGDSDSHYLCLHLAEASPLLVQDVLTALSHKLTITRRFEHIHRWSSVFGTDLRELDIRVGDKFLNSQVLCHLLKTVNLSSVKMVSSSLYLSALSQAPSLRTLDVSIMTREAAYAFMDVLSTLRLTSLSLLIHFQNSKRPGCGLAEMCNGDSQMLASRCPTLTCVRIDCRGHYYHSRLNDYDHQFMSYSGGYYRTNTGFPATTWEKCCAWSVLAAVPALCEFRISMVGFGYDRLSFNAFFENCERVPVEAQLSSPISSIRASISSNCLTITGFLSGKPQKSVQWRKFAVMNELCFIVPVVPSKLKSLHLEWPLDTKHIFWDEDYPEDNKKTYSSEPLRGTVWTSLVMVPELSELHLFYASLPPSEIFAILGVLGPKLEVLGISIEGQEESMDERLSYILEVAAVKNTSLRALYLNLVAIANHSGMGRYYHWRHSACEDLRRMRLRHALEKALYKWPYFQILDYTTGQVWTPDDLECLLFTK